ncbi:MAG: pitrilysin family protein [Candidatus Pacearchaeota archaeon]
MKPRFYRKVLKNGMTVVFEKRDSPTVSVAFAVRSGGIDEASSEKGISHFIEHMIFKKTKNRDSRQIASAIEKKGGVLNGFTDETVTAFWCKMPSRHVGVAFDILSDVVKNPLFMEQDIERERNVILEEINMYKDTPSHYVFNEMQKLLYKEPFGDPLIGTEKTLKSLTRKELLGRFEKFYRPENLVLCVVGDTDFRKIVDFAEKNFDFKWKMSGKKSRQRIVKRNKSKTEKRKGVDQANLVFAFHVPTLKDEKNYAARVLNVILAGGMSSRLFHEIREKRNLAYAIKGGSEIARDFAHSFIYAGTKKENVNNIKKIIIDEMKKVSKELDEKELAQAKEEMIGNLQISMEDSQAQMAYLLHHEIEGNAKDFYETEKNIKKVKLEDVKAVAKQAAKKYSFFALVPS